MWAARRSFLSGRAAIRIVRAVFRPPWGAHGSVPCPGFAFAGARGRGLPGVLPPPAFGRLRPRFAVPPGRRSVDLAGPPSNILRQALERVEPARCGSDGEGDRPRWSCRGARAHGANRREGTDPARPQCAAKDSFTSSWWADGGRRLRNEIDRNGSYELDRDQGTISAGVGASSCFSPSGGAHTHIALSEVCVTLRPRTTGFTTPRRCEGRRMAVKRTLMLQTHVRATARAGSHSYSPTPQAVIGDSWPPCKWPSRVASEPAPASEADRP